MLKIVICEDNLKILNHISKMIGRIVEKHGINGQLVCEANSPHSVEEYIKHNGANVFFIDIDLKTEYNGYMLAKKIRERDKRAYIIFVTGHLEYMLQAFKINTFDFLPKPVTQDILEQCLLNVHEDYLSIHPGDSGGRYIEVKSGSSLYRLKTKDIVYIEKLNSKTLIHMANSMITCFDTLEFFEKMLEDDDTFVRSHKSFIVNRSYISEIRVNKNEIIFETGQMCFIGRKYKKGLICYGQLQLSG